MRDIADRFGLLIHNANALDKPVAIYFRRRDQMSTYVVWGVMSKMLLSNAKFLDWVKLSIHVD